MVSVKRLTSKAGRLFILLTPKNREVGENIIGRWNNNFYLGSRLSVLASLSLLFLTFGFLGPAG